MRIAPVQIENVRHVAHVYALVSDDAEIVGEDVAVFCEGWPAAAHQRRDAKRTLRSEDIGWEFRDSEHNF